MNSLLHNPVYHALLSGDAPLGNSQGFVAWFDEAVSPFAGFPEGYAQGFRDLYDLLPAGRRILYARPEPINTPRGWSLSAAVSGVQFVYEGKEVTAAPSAKLVPLTQEHVPAMMELATLTKPGPFAPRTIDFGHYYGIFEGPQLVAMTGQRLHPGTFSEVSAVCTHPDHLGKGYAALLVQQQLALICAAGRTPFLHVRDDNERAIALYRRLGFTLSRPMHFYFLKKEGSV